MPFGDRAFQGDVTRRCRGGETIRVDLARSVVRDAAGRVERLIDAGRPLTPTPPVQSVAPANWVRAQDMLETMPTAIVRVDVGSLLPILNARGIADASALQRATDVDPGLIDEVLRHTRLDFGNRAARDLLAAEPWPANGSVAAILHERSRHDFAGILGAYLSGIDRCTANLRMLGRGLDVECEATALSAPGVAGDGALILCLVDVTAFRSAVDQSEQSREYYHVIFETMPIAMYRLDGSGGAALVADMAAVPDDERDAYLIAHPGKVVEMAERVVMAEVNRQGARLMRTPKEDLIGKSIRPLWGKRMDTYRRALGARIRNEFFEEETQIVAGNGELIDVLFAMAPVAHAGERFTIIGMVDLGALRRAEADLLRLQADFAHAARIATLGELTASLAHEVSQPLSAIYLCAETALRWLGRAEPGLAQAKGQLERVASHAGRATAVINRVRDMTLPTGSRRQVQNLSEIVEDALALVAPQARVARASLSIAGSETALPVMVDRVEIEQVIVNLVVNALQAMEAATSAEREITVTLSRDEHQVECIVADSGPGIEGADLGRVFDRFFTTKRDGMGLGLAICRTIMDAHDGTISVANRAERSGATLSLVLPVATSPSQHCPAARDPR